MNGSQPPDRLTDRRPILSPTGRRGWRFAASAQPIGQPTGRRRPSPDNASRGAWLLLCDGRPALGISRPG